MDSQSSPPKRNASNRAPELVREPDWQDVRLPFNIGSGRTLYAGLEPEGRMRLRVFRSQKDGSLVGRVWFGEGTDGPPGHVHGGASAYVLDEAMGAVGWMNDFPVVAAKLEFQYFRMVPLHVDLHLEARVLSASPKRLEVEASLKLPTGETCVSGRGNFAILSRVKFQALDTKGSLANKNLKWAADDAG